MKKLMFALAATFSLFALSDTNTVSRAEFDTLKRDVEALQEVVSRLHIFKRGQPELVKGKDGKYAVEKCGEHGRSLLVEKKVAPRKQPPATKNAATNAPTLLRK